MSKKLIIGISFQAEIDAKSKDTKKIITDFWDMFCEHIEKSNVINEAKLTDYIIVHKNQHLPFRVDDDLKPKKNKPKIK